MTSACWAVVPADQGWGDYGTILLHGMASQCVRVNGRIQLKRTAPYVPPLTLPGGVVVVTEEMRSRLDPAVGGAAFALVDKAHIVMLDWRAWDLAAPRPREYPPNAEPEGYILDRPHDAAAASLLPALFELIPPRIGRGATRTVGPPPRMREFYVDLGGELPPPLFRPAMSPYVFVSAVGRELLASCDDAAWRLQPATVGPLPEQLLADVLTVRVGEAIPDGYFLERTGTNPFTGEEILVVRRR